MDELIFLGYELLTVFIPFLIVYFITHKKFNRKQPHPHKTNDWRHILLLFIFLIYMFSIFNVTGVGTIYDILRTGIQWHPNQINLQLFYEGAFVLGYRLNLYLFIPFGFLLPLIWPTINKFWQVLLYGSFFSLAIELSQLLNSRVTDVDDLFMNTLGAIIGYLIYKLFRKIVQPKTDMRQILKHEPIFYLSAIFIGHFFLYNPMGLINILYDFNGTPVIPLSLI